MKRTLLAAMLTLVALFALATEVVKPFSAMKPGDALSAPLTIITLPKIKPNQMTLVADEGKTVLQVVSHGSASVLNVPLKSAAGSNERLNWQWKVSRVMDKADIGNKAHDDLSARVYVFFEVPFESLSLGARTKIRMARMFAGVDVPTAALCYVWDNRHPVGHQQHSTYTDRVRLMVLRSGVAGAMKWENESRDVAADFKRAFGFDAPAVTGVAIGNDTDQTGEEVTAWFGDIGFAHAAQ